MLLRLDHVQLAMPPGEEAAARAFYIDTLGFTELEKPASLASRGGCWFTGGSVVLHLGVEASFRPAKKAHPAFEVMDLDEFARQLEAAGLSLAWDDLLLPATKRFYLHDVFGNRLEFLQHFKTTVPVGSKV